MDDKYKNHTQRKNMNTVVKSELNSDPMYIYSMGLRHNSGIGAIKSEKQAIDCMIKASHMGCENAVDWLKTKAMSGNENISRLLAEMYEKGDGVEKSNKESIKWYEKIKNNPEISYHLALMYESEDCYRSRDIMHELAISGDNKAIRWLVNKPPGMVLSLLLDLYKLNKNIDILNYIVEKVHENNAEAISFVLSEAENNNVQMYPCAGYICEFIKKSNDDATYWYSKSMNSECLFKAGELYLKSLNNVNEAIKNYFMAANKGNDTAFSRLNDLHNEGHSSATYCLGIIYSQKNYSKAKKLMNEACEMGNDDAKKWIMDDNKRESTHTNNPYGDVSW